MDRPHLGLSSPGKLSVPNMPQPLPIGPCRTHVPPLPASIVGPVPKPRPPLPFETRSIVLTSATQALHKATSVPIDPPQPPLEVMRTSKVVLKRKAVETPKPKEPSAFKPAPPKSIPVRLPNHKRPDLSTMVIECYEPEVDEPHIK